MQSKRTEFEHEVFASSLIVQLKCFQQKSSMDDIILAELHQFERYLKFKLAKTGSDVAYASAIFELEAVRHSIVEEALRNFDIQKKYKKSQFGVGHLSIKF